jgi:hypothetical protein
MLTYKLGELYDNYINVVWKNIKEPIILLPKGYYLYVYSHEDTIFYVGRSVDPLDRLMQHMGRSKSRPCLPDAVGDLIQDNFPDSKEWAVTFYSLEDFSKTSDGQEASWLSFYRHMTGNLPGWPHEKETVSDLEEHLIAHLRPCMNRTNNAKGTLLPEKYIKQEIANKGVKLDY